MKSRSRRVARKSASLWRRHEWAILGIVGLVGLVLGFVGFMKLGGTRSALGALYRDLQLLVLEGGYLGEDALPWELQVARFLLPVVAAYAGLKGLALLFREQAGALRIRILPPRVVVCGLGERGLLIAHSLLSEGLRVVVVEKDRNNPLIEPCRRAGAVVLPGDATDAETLRSAGVRRARHLIAVCGDDRTNAEVAVRARELSRERRSGTLTCVVHVAEPRLCTLLVAHELGGGASEGFRLDCFNMFESAAAMLLRRYPPFAGPTGTSGGPALSGPADPAAEPHLLIVGLGRLGRSLLVQAARRWAAARPPSAGRLRMTVVDREAAAAVAALGEPFPQLDQVCDLNPLGIEVGSPEFGRGGYLFDRGGRCAVTRVYVCLGDESVAATAALTLQEHLRGRDVPIVVRMNRAGGLASLLEQQPEATVSPGGPDTLHVFGLLDQTYDAEMILGGTYEIIARATHEEYVRTQLGEGQTPETNPALTPWEDLPETLKESNRDQAAHIGVKLRAIGCGIVPWSDWDAESFGFTDEEIESLAQMEHERWVGERLRNGWTYDSGPKDLAKKRTPYLVPWEELGEEAREWDRAAVRGIPAFLARAGFQIVRPGTRAGARGAG